jgi:hypothetical protein
MPGFLEPIWEAVFRVATWSALIFGALSIGSAFVSAWVGWEITDATQKDADRKIKAADERIAEFNARAMNAELELERLRKKTEPRRLNDEAFLAPLKKLPPQRFKVLYVPDTPDAIPLAMEILIALQRLRWVTTEIPAPIEAKDSMLPPGISFGSAMSVGAQPTGISIILKNIDPDNPVAAALMKSLSDAFGVGSAGRNENIPDDFVLIVIAPRM